jgi:hypothetical protein
MMVQREIEPRQVQRPMSLMTVQFLGRHEVFEVLVIYPDLNLVLSTLEEVSPLLECTHHHQHLLAMDLVVMLYGTKAF